MSTTLTSTTSIRTDHQNPSKNLILQNHWANCNQFRHKASFGEEN